MRRLILLPMALLVACAEVPPRPVSTATPNVGPSEPAPMPSQAADDYVAAQRARGQPAEVGPAAMPGFATPNRIGTDVALPPLPAQRSPAFSRP